MSLSLLVQTVPKAKANSVWQWELLMRMSLRNSIYRPQSDAQQTHLTPLQLIPLAPIKHKEDILGEVSVCLQVRSPSCIKSQIFQKVAISFWQIVTMGEWFLGYHLYSSSVKLQKNAGKTHMESTSTIKGMGGVWLESTAQMELWHRTERTGHSGFDSLSHIANPGYQPSQEPNLCSCYVTFVTPPAATCKILLYQEKDTNQNRDEQWAYKRILNSSCCYFGLAELMISIIRHYSGLCQVSLKSSSKN